MIVLLSYKKDLLLKTELFVSSCVNIGSYCKLKYKIMIGVSSTGSFSTLSANQSLLNSRKGRPFLNGGSIHRFHNSDIELSVKEQSLSKRAQFKTWLKKETAHEKKVSFLILVISVLVVQVLMLSIA